MERDGNREHANGSAAGTRLVGIVYICNLVNTSARQAAHRDAPQALVCGLKLCKNVSLTYAMSYFSPFNEMSLFDFPRGCLSL